MICPNCGHRYKNPGNVRAGARGGAVRGVRKGFAVPGVLAKALATRQRAGKRPTRVLVDCGDGDVMPKSDMPIVFACGGRTDGEA